MPGEEEWMGEAGAGSDRRRVRGGRQRVDSFPRMQRRIKGSLRSGEAAGRENC